MARPLILKLLVYAILGPSAHPKGAFVSKWVVNKTNLSVASGSDLITKVKY